MQENNNTSDLLDESEIGFKVNTDFIDNRSNKELDEINTALKKSIYTPQFTDFDEYIQAENKAAETKKRSREKKFDLVKDSFIGTLGFIGMVLWYVISFAFIMAPLYVIGVPFWVTIIACILLSFFSEAMVFINLALYPWAFIVAINGKQDIFAIIFYIFFAIWVLSSLIPILLDLISYLISKFSRW